MTISIIRAMTQTDDDRLEKAARAFIIRHALGPTENTCDNAKAIASRVYDDKRLASLWQRCYCRALRLPYDARLTDNGKYVGRRVI